MLAWSAQRLSTISRPATNSGDSRGSKSLSNLKRVCIRPKKGQRNKVLPSDEREDTKKTYERRYSPAMGVEIGTGQCDLRVKRPSLPDPRRMGGRWRRLWRRPDPRASVATQQASGAVVAPSAPLTSLGGDPETKQFIFNRTPTLPTRTPSSRQPPGRDTINRITCLFRWFSSSRTISSS